MMDANIREALHKALDKFLDNMDIVGQLPNRLRQIEGRLLRLETGGKLAYSLKEVSKLTGLSYSYWHTRVEKGDLNCMQDGHGGKIVIKHADLINYIEDHSIDVKSM